MKSTPVASPAKLSPSGRTLIPVLAGCLIGLILFLIGGVIVLALIPVDLKSGDVQARLAPSTQFSLTLLLRNGHLPLGSLTVHNCAVIQKQLRQQALANHQVHPAVPTVTSCTVSGNSTSTNGRKKRAMGRLISVGVILSPGDCPSDQCSIRRANALINLLLRSESVSLTFFQSDGSSLTSTVAFISATAVTFSPPSATCSSTSSYPDLIVYAVTADHQLLQYNANHPGTVLSRVNLTGLLGEDLITNIDYRVASDALYGFSQRQFYLIDVNTGVVRAVEDALDPATQGNVTGFEVDPSTDIPFYVTNVNRTALPASETNEVESLAFDHNFAGASNSTLYILNATSDTLSKATFTGGDLLAFYSVGDAPQIPIGSGLGLNISRSCGFDISPNGTALACVQIGPTRSFYLLDFLHGRFTRKLGEISEAILSLAIPTLPVAYSIVASKNSLVSISTLPCSYQTVMKNLSGLQSNETIVALETDPATFLLYALASSSRLYSIDFGSARATPIGSGPFTTVLNGTSFGMAVNPVSGLIQVMSNTGQQLLINKTSGEVLQASTQVHSVTAIAFTNKGKSSTLYAIDSLSDRLLKQENPQLNGTFLDVGPLGVDADENNGFDIQRSSGDAYALLTVDGQASLYSINLLTGEATLAPNGTFPWSARALALGWNS